MSSDNVIFCLVFVSWSLLFKSSTLDHFPLKLACWLKDFPLWRAQVFVSCEKSIRTKQANPSPNTLISADKKINLAQIFGGNSFSCAGNYMCIICIENKDDLCTTFSAANPFPVRQNRCAQSCKELMQRRLFQTGCELPHRKWKYQTKPTRDQQEMEQTNQIVEILYFPAELALSYATCQTDSR